MVLVLVVAIAPATDAARPRTTPPPSEPTIRDAFDALVDLRAYRFRVDSRLPGGGAETTTTGTVLRRPVWRYAIETTRGGEVFMLRVGTSRGSWESGHGSAFRRTKARFDKRHPRISLDLVIDLFTGGMPLSMGVPGPVEVRDGRQVRSLTFTWPPLEEGRSSGFVGMGELWLDATDGYLVESHLVGDLYYGTADGRSGEPSPVDEHLVITDIGSQDLVVDLPDEGPVKPASFPPGDPDAEARITGAIDRLEELTSYRITSSPALAFIFSDQRITVVNRPVPVALVETGMLDQVTLRLLVTEDSWWTASDDADWSERNGAFFWDTCEGRPPCSFASVTEMWSGLLEIAPTFRMVVQDELVDGIPAIHLRSDVGMVDSIDGWIPGTWDVWIARDGGHLLRQSFDGQAIASSVTITGVDDPANSLTIPGDG
jgi:hypothetical protein